MQRLRPLLTRLLSGAPANKHANKQTNGRMSKQKDPGTTIAHGWRCRADKRRELHLLRASVSTILLFPVRSGHCMSNTQSPLQQRRRSEKHHFDTDERVAMIMPRCERTGMFVKCWKCRERKALFITRPAVYPDHLS